ncbi:hypothetical protein HY489_01710 [Candidatus Woesearchaeota archaeon]|nr:hypothetical protein [Candidatus Woesearchaeota archaeon]
MERVLLWEKDIKRPNTEQQKVVGGINHVFYGERKQLLAPDGKPLERPLNEDETRRLAEIDRGLDYRVESAMNRLNGIERGGRFFTLRPRFVAQHGQVDETLTALRDTNTDTCLFREAVRDAYIQLLAAAFSNKYRDKVIQTPVDRPYQQSVVTREAYSPDLENTCIGVFLRAGILPAVVTGDWVQRQTGRTPEYAIFRPKRKEEGGLHHVSEEEHTFYTKETIEGKHFVIPEIMCATGGSLFAIEGLLREEGITPAKITMLALISALPGVYNVANNSEARLASFRIDPTLNDDFFIMPGLGDAGDRLVGKKTPADLCSLFRVLGKEFCRRYKDQVHALYSVTRETMPSDIF